MNLENLLKLSIKDLTILPIEEYDGLSMEDRICLIGTKEKEGSMVLFAGICILSPEEAKDLEYLKEMICPELLKKTNSLTKKKKQKKDLFANSTNDSKIEFKNEKKILSDYESLRISEYNPYFRQLSLKKRNYLHDFVQKTLLSSDFTATDLMDIFEYYEVAEVYEKNHCYSAKDALYETLCDIEEEYGSLMNFEGMGLVIIIGISPEFEWKEGLLDGYRNIVNEFLNGNNEVNVAVVEDDGFFGTCDLYVRIYEYFS